MLTPGNRHRRFRLSAFTAWNAMLFAGFLTVNAFAAGSAGFDPDDDTAIPADEPFLPVIRLIKEGGMIYSGRNEGIPVAEGTIASSLSCEEVMDRLVEVCRRNGYSYHRSDPTMALAIGFLNVRAKEGKRTFMIFSTPESAATIVKFSIELLDDLSGQQPLANRFPELADLGETLKNQKETLVPGAATATFLYQDSFQPEMALTNAKNILERAGWRRAFGQMQVPQELEADFYLFYKDQFLLWLHAKAQGSGRTFMMCQLMQQGEIDPIPRRKKPRGHRPVIKIPELGAEKVLP